MTEEGARFWSAATKPGSLIITGFGPARLDRVQTARRADIADWIFDELADRFDDAAMSAANKKPKPNRKEEDS